MGEPKMLLDWGGKTIIQHVVQTLLSAGLTRISVVVGAHRERIAEVLTEEPVQLVYNREWATGEMLSSVQAGLKAESSQVKGVLIVPGDHPAISTTTIDTMVTAFLNNNAAIVLPEFHGRTGHPLIIHHKLWDEVLSLDRTVGLRQLMHNHIHEILRVDIGTDEIFRDIDTPEEYQAALDAFVSKTTKQD
jgi:molybdenum cofactor cytidylyltransferase